MGVEDLPRPRGRPGATHRQWSADPQVLADVRRTVGTWLHALGIASELCEDLVYATSEAASNAVEHAYRSAASTGTVAIAMWVETGAVNIEIADRGCWLPVSAYPTSRGHGLQLIRGLVESVDIASSSSGTTVSLRHSVPGLSSRQVEPARGG